MPSSRPSGRSPSRQPVLGPCCGFDPTLEEWRVPPRWATWTARLALLAVAVALVVILIRWG